jgi:hypothetical protein
MTIETTKEVVISPYGGKLVDLVATGEERDALLQEAYRWLFSLGSLHGRSRLPPGDG